MQLISFDYVLWAASFVGNILLFATILQRRVARQLPVFTIWIAFSIVRTIVLYLVNRRLGLSAYFYVYWTLQVCEVVIELGLAMEAIRKVFRPLGTIVPDAKQPMVLIVWLSVVAALGLTLLAAPPTRLSIESTVMRGDLFSYVLLSELFAWILYLSSNVGLWFPQQVQRAVTGFVIYGLASFLAVGLQNVFGLSHGGTPYKLLSWTQISAYLASLSYWIVAFSRKPKPIRAMPLEMKAQLEALSAWWASIAAALLSSEET